MGKSVLRLAAALARHRDARAVGTKQPSLPLELAHLLTAIQADVEHRFRSQGASLDNSHIAVDAISLAADARLTINTIREARDRESVEFRLPSDLIPLVFPDKREYAEVRMASMRTLPGAAPILCTVKTLSKHDHQTGARFRGGIISGAIFHKVLTRLPSLRASGSKPISVQIERIPASQPLAEFSVGVPSPQKTTSLNRDPHPMGPNYNADFEVYRQALLTSWTPHTRTNMSPSIAYAAVLVEPNKTTLASLQRVERYNTSASTPMTLLFPKKRECAFSANVRNAVLTESQKQGLLTEIIRLGRFIEIQSSAFSATSRVYTLNSSRTINALFDAHQSRIRASLMRGDYQQAIRFVFEMREDVIQVRQRLYGTATRTPHRLLESSLPLKTCYIAIDEVLGLSGWDDDLRKDFYKELNSSDTQANTERDETLADETLARFRR